MSGPLAGLRVLEMCNFTAGPHAGMILADLGAQVIKVEPPEGDVSRVGVPVGPHGESLHFINTNRNKQSVVLDLKTPEGKDVLLKLVGHSDVLLHNLRPGAMEGLGLDYPALRAINPRIIYCAISGYGHNGPLRDRPGFDFLLQGHSGVAHLIADEGGEPMTTRLSVIDLNGGTHAALGILAAIAGRERTGEGQFVDISLLDCAVSLLDYSIPSYFITGQSPPRLKGSAHPHFAPSQIFRTGDGHIIIIVAQNNMFERLCQILGVPEAANDPRFASTRLRSEHRGVLLPMLQERLLTRTTAQWLEPMRAAGITAGPVNTMAEALHDPQVQARHLAVKCEHPVEGTVTIVGNPIKLSANPDVFRHAPMLGEHTHIVLTELLGMTDSEIAHLREVGGCRLGALAVE